jgi:hypothetical protein
LCTQIERRFGSAYFDFGRIEDDTRDPFARACLRAKMQSAA